MTTDFLYCLNINEWYSSEETERKAKEDDKLVYLVMGKKETAESYLIIQRKNGRGIQWSVDSTYSLCIGRKQDLELS